MYLLLAFLLCYLLLLIFGTLTVAGWFFITRGFTETLPDGTVIRKGKIFRAWYFFITQSSDTERRFYQGKQLRAISKEIKQLIEMTGSGHLLAVHEGAVSLQLTNPGILQIITDQLDVQFMPKGDGYYSIYKDYPVYLFPEWVRHPLAVCATCFASVYGSLWYFLAVYFVGDIFWLFKMPTLAILFFWITFVLQLAVTLTAVAKKWN